MTVTAQPTPRRERRRNARGEGARLRLEILEATQQLMTTGDALTLRSIARQAGIAAPSIYRHFADVDAIMAVLAEQAFEDLTAELVQGRNGKTDAIARLRAVCTSYLQYARDKPHLYRLMFGAVWNAEAALENNPDAGDRFRALGSNAHAILVEAIDECVQVGASESSEPEQDATALWVGLHGFAQLRDTARLFPWPADTEDVLVTRLGRLRSP